MNEISVQIGDKWVFEINPQILITVLGYKNEQFIDERRLSQSSVNDDLIRIIQVYQKIRENDYGVLIISGKDVSEFERILHEYNTERGLIKLSESTILFDVHHVNQCMEKLNQELINYDLLIAYQREKMTVYSNKELVFSRNISGVSDYLAWWISNQEMIEDMMVADVFEHLIFNYPQHKDVVMNQLSSRFVVTMKKCIGFPMVLDRMALQINNSIMMSQIIHKLIHSGDSSFWDLPFQVAMLYRLGDYL